MSSLQAAGVTSDECKLSHVSPWNKNIQGSALLFFFPSVVLGTNSKSPVSIHTCLHYLSHSTSLRLCSLTPLLAIIYLPWSPSNLSRPFHWFILLRICLLGFFSWLSHSHLSHQHLNVPFSGKCFLAAVSKLDSQLLFIFKFFCCPPLP